MKAELLTPFDNCTKGKLYDVATGPGGLYIFTNDDGNQSGCMPEHFQIVLSENATATELTEVAAAMHDAGVRAMAPTGRKDDGGKLDMTLFDDMPRALEAVAEVMQWAITKKEPVPYVRGSWLGVSADRYRAAIKRHDSTACKQASTAPTAAPSRFQRDDETKLLHLAHQACSALFALELTLREMEVTDVE